MGEVAAFWAKDPDEELRELGVSLDGLSSSEAAERSARYGENRIAEGRRPTGIRLLLSQFTSPIILVLLGCGRALRVPGRRARRRSSSSSSSLVSGPARVLAGARRGQRGRAAARDRRGARRRSCATARRRDDPARTRSSPATSCCSGRAPPSPRTRSCSTRRTSTSTSPRSPARATPSRSTRRPCRRHAAGEARRTRSSWGRT